MEKYVTSPSYVDQITTHELANIPYSGHFFERVTNKRILLYPVMNPFGCPKCFMSSKHNNQIRTHGQLNNKETELHIQHRLYILWTKIKHFSLHWNEIN